MEDRLQLLKEQRRKLRSRLMRPRKHHSQFRMTDYSAILKKKEKKTKRKVKKCEVFVHRQPGLWFNGYQDTQVHGEHQIVQLCCSEHKHWINI